jgi:hypothetical protein
VQDHLLTPAAKVIQDDVCLVWWTAIRRTHDSFLSVVIRPVVIADQSSRPLKITLKNDTVNTLTGGRTRLELRLPGLCSAESFDHTGRKVPQDDWGDAPVRPSCSTPDCPSVLQGRVSGREGRTPRLRAGHPRPHAQPGESQQLVAGLQYLNRAQRVPFWELC